MDELTAAMRETLGDAGINLKRLAAKTGISYCALYNSLGFVGKGRDLRAEKFMKICRVLKRDPWEFIP